MAGVEVARWRLQERSAVTPEEPGETDGAEAKTASGRRQGPEPPGFHTATEGKR
jgi:hypothetical protein